MKIRRIGYTPLWPTNGSARVYEHVVEGISDVTTLVVDGRPASELGVDSQNDDGKVHLWLTAGTHSVRVDGRDETFDVKDSYALVAAGTSAPTSGPHAAGERVALEARRAWCCRWRRTSHRRSSVP